MAAVSGEKTLAELSAEFGVHPDDDQQLEAGTGEACCRAHIAWRPNETCEEDQSLIGRSASYPGPVASLSAPWFKRTSNGISIRRLTSGVTPLSRIARRAIIVMGWGGHHPYAFWPGRAYQRHRRSC
jgi:hypothetical protein